MVERLFVEVRNTTGDHFIIILSFDPDQTASAELPNSTYMALKFSD